MTAYRLRPLPFLALALLAAVPSQAQEVVQSLPGTTDADALAADMRRVASNPRDVDALVDAARLSLRLDDVRAAAALLQRAENVDARNPRVRAGQGSVLVQSERPGQALRYFAEAEAGGLGAGSFAADRALAYDLTGQQEHAQRDYARALRDAPNDEETIRRYALSLGISGQRSRALALLDPLVRRGDRAAWRSQAFVLAMTGDMGGAQRIAATMMPGGAAGLSAFFERLPTLPAADRAFAVHFGEVRPTPERLADARLAPPVAPLPREPVVLASAQPLPQPVQPRSRRDRDRDRDRTIRTAAPTVLASTQPRAEPVRSPELDRPFRVGDSSVSPTVIAAVSPARRTSPPIESVARAPVPVPQPATTLLAARETPATTVVAASPTPAFTRETPAPQTPTFATPGAAIPTPAPVELAAVTTAPSAGTLATVSQPQPQPMETVALPPSSSLATAVARPAAAPPHSGVARASEDTILARIIAGLSIPGSELGVEEPARPAPAPAPAAVVMAPPPAPAPGRAEAPAPVVAQVDRAALDRQAAAARAADRRAAERKAVADRKALADKKAAAEKKALADKEAAEQRRVERANPERIWVQVAGGAFEGDLPKAYAAVKARAPAVFGSRGGYTAPLRATNRVLTGPFKTDAEARAFVNDLKREGVSAFTFTSDSGQPVSRLDARGKADAADDDDKPAPVARAKRRR